MRLLIPFLMCLTLQAAWPNGYSYRATFTVKASQITGTVANLPVYINETNAAFALTATGKVQNTTTQTSGGVNLTVPRDFIFTDSSSTQVKWEFESYNSSTGAIKAQVLCPSCAVGTVLYGYYGKAGLADSFLGDNTGLWSAASAVGVWHVKDGTTLSCVDATNTNNLSLYGTPNPTAGTGKIDGGFVASVNGDCRKTASTTGLPTGAADRTVCAWVSNTNSGTLTVAFKYGSSTSKQGVLLYKDTSNKPNLGFYAYSFPTTTTTLPTDGTWTHVCGRLSSSGGTVTLYVNGASDTTTTGVTGVNTVLDHVIIGSLNVATGNPWIGSIDEPRVYSDAKSDAWIEASYHTQNAQGGTFYDMTNVNAEAPSINRRRVVAQ